VPPASQQPPGSYPPPGSSYPPQSGYPPPGAPPPGYPPPGAPPPGYPPAGGPVPGAPPPKKKTGLIIGIVAAAVVLVLAGCAIGAVVLIRTLGGGSPESAVNDYFSAYRDADFDKAMDATCAIDRENIDESEWREEVGAIEQLEWSIVSVDESGDEATVRTRVSVTFQGQTDSQTLPVPVVKEDGDWRVCGID
jgi:hypothetical protein